MGQFGIPERTEKEHISLKFKTGNLEKYHRELIATFPGHELTFKGDNCISIDFDIRHEYYNITKRINLLLTILGNGDKEIIDINLEELEHGCCLIRDLYMLFERLRKELRQGGE
jgi:hypothetical protein